MRPGRVGSLGCEGLAGSREMRVTREVVGSAPVTADDGTRAAPSAASGSGDSSMSPGAVLGAAIERDFVSLQRAVELLVWRFLVRQGRPLNHEAFRTTAEDVLQEAIARVLKRAAAYVRSARLTLGCSGLPSRCSRSGSGVSYASGSISLPIPAVLPRKQSKLLTPCWSVSATWQRPTDKGCWSCSISRTLPTGEF